MNTAQDPGDTVEPAADAGGHGADWVVVQQFANGVDADLARTLLSTRGIPAVLENREFIGMDWALAVAAGWIKVLVPPDRVGEALGVLRRANAARGPDLQLGVPGALEDAERCLHCGGALPVGDAVCDACGWSYLDEVEAESSLPVEGAADRVGETRDESWQRASWRTALVVGALCVLAVWLLFQLVVNGWLISSS